MNGSRFLPRAELPALLTALQRAGYRCVGPQVRSGAIVYDVLDSIDVLPHGWHVDQQPGIYRMHHGDSPRCFAWANGPQAIKPQLFAARETLWAVQRNDDGRLEFRHAQPQAQPLAIIGVRACDIAALRLQDQVFVNGPYTDAHYTARREGLFIVAVHCSHPAATCFCAATGDGPVARDGFDLALSELDDGFLIQAGSVAGQGICAQLPLQTASDHQLYVAGQEHLRAARQQRRLPGHNLRQALMQNLDHPRWDDVAQRCLACGNCTMVCPTCFCHAERDEPALDGAASSHVREWDSCFTQGHSYIHGSVIRQETKLRYRQWLTHKLATWHDQFGRSGCVGCGRCIAWCPVGIDITEEAAAIAAGVGQ